MNHRAGKLLALATCLCLAVLFPVAEAGASTGLPVLRQGARGPAVVLLQDLLYRAGFLQGAPDGHFGTATAQATRAFQEAANLPVDGVVGPSTWAALREQAAAQPVFHVVKPGETLSGIARRYGTGLKALAAANGISDPDRIRAGTRLAIPRPGQRAGVAGRPELLLWSEGTKVFPRGKTARVIDVQTGRSFEIRRFAGTYHADVEPLTARDTQVMREVYGGRWSWERRAIILEVDGRRIAASMNGQPHGRGAISGNGFNGHFCIHMLGSTTHGTRRIDYEHQRKIMEAAGYRTEPHWVRTAARPAN